MLSSFKKISGIRALGHVCNTPIIARSNILYLTVKRLFSPSKHLFSQNPSCFPFPLQFTFSNQDCADQIMPYIVSMQGSLPGFQHTCTMHVSPGRQHNCIRLEVQQCIKPTCASWAGFLYD